MAHASNAGTDANCSGAPRHSTAQFQPFEWVQAKHLAPPQHHQAAFLNEARDIVQGAHTLVQLLSWDEDRRETALSASDPAPLFDPTHRDSLQRLLAASLSLLHARIEHQCEMLLAPS